MRLYSVSMGRLVRYSPYLVISLSFGLPDGDWKTPGVQSASSAESS